MCDGLPAIQAEVMETPNPLLQFSDDLARAVETGSQSLVAVHGRPHVPSSGILWRESVVVTTSHTLKRDQDITITLPDGRTVAVTLAGRDRGTDLAVLRVSEKVSAPDVAAGASLKPGNLVLALGRRSENGVTVGMGVVSAVAGAWRTWFGGEINQFIRPDIGIFTGFSGGTLVDVAGRVIGLNTTGLTRGAGVTVPAVTVSRVVDELLLRGHVRRGFLGVGFHPVQLPDGRVGLVILSLEPKGAAARAGVMVGDVLIALEGQPVTDTDDVQAHLGSDRVGKPLAAEFLRGGVSITLEMTPDERPVRKC
jgi:S1-C subfamily serine protease